MGNCRETISQLGLGDQDRRPGVRQDNAQTLIGAGGVQRDIGGSSLEHPQDGRQHLRRTLQTQSHECLLPLWGGTYLPQLPGDPVRPGIQVAVAQGVFATAHGNRLRARWTCCSNS